jgi:sporadic carbohydrate cluster 2OG-Fe(II) oxygenase
MSLETLGYVILNFKNKKKVKQLKQNLENQLKKITKIKDINFKNYHIKIINNDHQNIQWKLANYFWRNKFHIKYIEEIKEKLIKLFGQDILIQKNPFLRIARPFVEEDNIGLHKDTLYGQSPFEMSIHVPLVTLGSKSCLKFVAKSFKLKEKKIQFKEIKTIIKKGSKQHKLGKPYDPKIIDENKYNAKPIPLKFGQCIFFTPALIHGQVLNKDKNTTRFSFDVRVVSKYAPIDFIKKSRNGKYITFSQSQIQTLAKEYLAKN